MPQTTKDLASTVGGGDAPDWEVCLVDIAPATTSRCGYLLELGLDANWLRTSTLSLRYAKKVMTSGILQSNPKRIETVLVAVVSAWGCHKETEQDNQAVTVGAQSDKAPGSQHSQERDLLNHDLDGRLLGVGSSPTSQVCCCEER